MEKQRCLQASSDGASCIGVDEKMCAKCEWLSLMGDWCELHGTAVYDASKDRCESFEMLKLRCFKTTN